MNPSEIVNGLRYVAKNELKEHGMNTERSIYATEAADLIEGLIPRPIGTIANETDLPALLISEWKTIFLAETWNDYSKRWNISDGWIYPNEVTHFIPLSAIQKLMESGE